MTKRKELPIPHSQNSQENLNPTPMAVKSEQISLQVTGFTQGIVIYTPGGPDSIPKDICRFCNKCISVNGNYALVKDENTNCLKIGLTKQMPPDVFI
ncbi:MAG: hypothetical protein NZ893_02945 [Candidatus Aenigmarchaeota archaeon]|nr:hypothetical protein [Candidatus Aenigmarchaeota archaeon]